MRARGLTLVELVVAVGLASLLMLALVRLVDTSLGVWRETETRRDVSEHLGALSELVFEELAALEPGPRGDLLADWAAHDADGDGIAGLVLQRVRLVRPARDADRARSAEVAQGRESRPERSAAPATGAAERRVLGRAQLAEVALVLLPDPERGADGAGRLVVCERLLDVPLDAPLAAGADEALFAPEFFDARGLPPAHALREVSRSVLWLELSFASQATSLADGWRLGDDPLAAGSAWDAWTCGRTDEDLSPLNAIPTGTPTAKELPVLPRRIRIALELERPADLARRTVLAAPAGHAAKELVLRDARFAPAAGAHARIGEEWVRVLSSSDGRLSVERGARGSRAAEHPAGSLVHFGWKSERELALATHREDWNL